MDQNIEAIFENGVLRPLEPVDLKESQRVQLSIHVEPVAADLMSAEQHESILDLIDAMEKMPQRSPNDGLSNRDHDKMLYGFCGN
jgi:predicted DNA-binding antitoxin AbrB/MazE fold protein